MTEANDDAGESAAAVIELTAALARYPEIIVVDGSNALQPSDTGDVGYGLRDAIDQVLLVVVTGRMRQNELRAAVERLRTQNLPILGAVLTPPALASNNDMTQQFSISSTRRGAK